MLCEKSMTRKAPDLRRARLSTTLLFLTFGIVEATWASRIPLIRGRLHLTDAGLSLALAGPAVGLLIAARGAPRFVERFRNSQAARLALLASSAGLILPALAWNLPSLAIGLAVWGACLGTMEITMNARGSALERSRERSLLSGLHAGYSMAVLAFAPVGALAAHLRVSPLVHFGVVAGGCLIAGIVFGPSSRDDLVALPAVGGAGHIAGDGETNAAADADAHLRLRTHPTLVALAFVGFCALVAEGSVGNWSGVFLRQTDHASLALAPFGLAAFSAGMVAGRLSGDALITRRGHYPLAWRAAALAACGLLVAVCTNSVAVAIAGYAILGIGLSVLIPIVFALAAATPGISPVWALSRMTTATYVGLFVGPPVIGALATAITLRGSLMCVAGLLVAVAVIGRRLARQAV
jgi:fucose permease